MPDQPNLLFIFSDQHAARVAGCYGDAIAVTPNLDKLAAGGVVFQNAYCSSPLCTPSRMSAMTARHPYRNRVWGNQDILHSGIPTFAHALGAAGLDPVLVGRLHSVGPDQLLGYARREVGDHHANWTGVPRVDMGPLEGTASPDRRSLTNSGSGQSAYEVKDEDVIEATLAELDQFAAEIADGSRERFAMTCGLMLPHAPFVARFEDFQQFEDQVGLAQPRAPQSHNEHPWLAAWREKCEITDVSEAEERRARAAYYGLVASMDRGIGKVLDRLETLGLADNTLVVYSSDHGEQLGAHGMWWKHTFYEDSVKVPMILRWPGTLPAGERREQVVSLIDLTATMLEATGAPPLPHADGISFLDLARSSAAPWIDCAYAEYCQGSRFDWGISGPSQNRMIRQGRYKLIYYHGFVPQLFDLEEDPNEEVDLAGDCAHASIVNQLTEEILRGWDPDVVRAQIEETLDGKALMAKWAHQVNPPSHYMWQMLPEHNRLDTDSA
jgi:choline-sulfatase